MTDQSLSPSLAVRASEWALRDASTRPIALLRLLTVCLVWAKWGKVGAIYAVYPDPEGLAMAVLFFGSSVSMLLGFQTRLSTLLLALVLGYGYHILGVEEGDRGPWVHHHTTLLKTLVWLLVLTPCGRSLSVDRLLELRRADKCGKPARDEVAPIWGQRLVALQLFAMYAWAALAKLSPPFLSGRRMEAYITEFYWGADVPNAAWFHAVAALLGTGTVLLEAFLAGAMLFPKMQRFFLPLGALLHLSFYMLLPVSTFSATVVAMYIAVIPPERIEELLLKFLSPSRQT